MLSLVSVAVGQGTAARLADEIFLRQLTERRLFDAAELFCRQHLERLQAVDERAAWQLRLSRILDQHAWFEPAASRDGLLSQAIDLTTEFLGHEPVSAESEFRLRLQQVRTLIHGIRISLLLQQAGHLAGRAPLTGRTAPDVGAALMPGISRALELTESLEQQLEKLRDDIDDAGRTVRSELRLLQAELHALKWRLNSEEDNQQRAVAERLLSPALKSSLSAAEHNRAAWLLAELALLDGQDDEFRLKVQAVDGGLPEADGDDSVVLQIQSLLSRNESTAAAQLVANQKPNSQRHAAVIEWLRLEVLLADVQMAQQLKDESLLKTAVSNFDQRWRAMAVPSGVYRDAADRVQRRLQLVLEVGVEVADLVEQIEIQQSAGATDRALRLIRDSLERLQPSGTEQSRGILQLRAAELLIGRQEWTAAEQELASAEQHFERIGLKDRLAVTKLLQIFVMAQHLRTETSVPQLWDDYAEALRDHLRRFPDQPTAEKAREWLLQAVETSRPDEAVNLALQMFDAQDNPLQKLTILERAAELLSTAVRNQPSRFVNPDVPVDSQVRELAVRFRERLARLEEDDREKLDAARLAALNLIAVEIDLSECSVPECDWSRLDARLADCAEPLRQLKQQIDTETPPYADRALCRRTLLDAAIACRRTSDSQRLANIHAELNAMSSIQKKAALVFLGRQFGGRDVQVGDVWLARTCNTLSRSLLDSAATEDRSALALWLLPRAVRCSAVTQETDLQSQLLDVLLAARLTEDQLNEIAAMLSTSHAAAAGRGKTIPFWNQILRRHPAGSNLWLEASLQLAQAAATSGDPDEARRQLTIVQTLYPDWGNTERLSRARRLLQTVQAK
ncbi:MAG: hypothetical protein R3C49_08205 [Planctomycetaceae bacterium]